MHLVHHGILGQKWGVRRYQNPDGTLTPEGKKRYSIAGLQYRVDKIENRKSFGKEYRRRHEILGKLREEERVATKDDVQSILDSMSKEDLRKIAIHDTHSYTQGRDFVKRFVLKDARDIPVSFIDFQDDHGVLNVVIGTRSGEQYRNKGYASAVAKEGMRWVEENGRYLEKSYDYVQWLAYSDNKASRATAEKLGFELDYDEGWESEYSKKIPRS